MRPRLAGFAFCLLVFALLLSSASEVAAQSAARRYRIIDLGTLPGGTFSRANAINNQGEIAAESLLADNCDVQAFYWRGGTVRSITPPYSPGACGFSSAIAINNHGQVLGTYDSSAFPNTPPAQVFLYNGRANRLTFLHAGSAKDINDAGQILAFRSNAPLPGGNYYIGGTGQAVALPFTAIALNSAGKVVGFDASGAPVMYSQGSVVSLGSGFQPSDINDADQIVGGAVVNLGFGTLRSRTVLRQPDGTVQTFAPLNSLGNSRAAAINNRGQIVGTESTIVSGRTVRTAFIIENGVTRRVDSLLPPNSGWVLSGDFGEANDINDRGEIVGTGLINGEWHAYLLTTDECSSAEDVDGDGNSDNDGDGLCDAWEVNGVDGDGDGIPDLDLAALGADMNHKDLFLEVDYMAGPFDSDQPDQGGLVMVKNAFAGAPVSNPDQVQGIRLHMVGDGTGGMVDEALPHSDEMTFPEYIDSRCPATSFNDLKNSFFGTLAERSSASAAAILNAKRKVFRYVIFAHRQADSFDSSSGACTDDGSSGVAELPGNDFIVTIGDWDPTPFAATSGCSPLDSAYTCGRRQIEAGTLMHELGHTLTLGHGGGDYTNCKPNYLSLMSYVFQFPSADPTRPLNYSSALLPSLDKANLSEPAGIQGPAARWTFFGARAFGYLRGGAADGALNWNDDLDASDVGVSADIDRIDNVGGCDVSGPTAVGQLLNIRFSNALDATTFPDPNTFSVTVDGVAHAPLSVDVTPFNVEMVLSTPVAPFQSVAVAYTRPALNPLTAADGSIVGDFNLNVTNRTYSLTGYDDWPNLLYSFRLSPDFQDGVARVALPVERELTLQSALVMAQSFDFDGDGLSNAIDNCDEVPNPSQTDANGNGIGDACEGGAPPADTTAPVLTLPADITMEATGASGAAVNFAATANDNVDGNVAVTCNPASGATFTLGTTTVNCSASDASNNTANGSFDVTVQDTTPPALTLPGNITTTATSSNGAVVNFSASAADLVSGAVPVNCVPASGATFAIGTTTVNCSASDAAGNIASGSFAITVNPQPAPPGTRITARIAAQQRLESDVIAVDVELSNVTQSAFSSILLRRVTLRTTGGSGSVQNTKYSPVLPYAIGSLNGGGTVTLRFVLRVPATVTQFTLQTAGTGSDTGANFEWEPIVTIVP